MEGSVSCCFSDSFMAAYISIAKKRLFRMGGSGKEVDDAPDQCALLFGR
jgi:hypothetical protein